MKPPTKFQLKHAACAALLVGLTALSSCAHLMYLDQAQNQFNRAATLENEMRFNPQAEVPASPTLYYNSAYAAVNKALGNKGALDKDNVLANAYTIKALCEWKLAMYDQAQKSADDAHAEYLALERKGILMPRDKALMKALPHIMSIDRAKNELYKFYAGSNIGFDAARNHYLTEIHDPAPDKTGKLEASLQKLGEARSGIQGNEDLVVYFALSHLAGLKTWSDGLDFLRQRAAADTSLDPQAKTKAGEFILMQRDKALLPAKEELLGILRKLLPEDQAKPLEQYWNRRI